MKKVKFKEMFTKNKEASLFALVGFLCLLAQLILYLFLSFSKTYNSNLIFLNKNFYLLEGLFIAIISVFYSVKTKGLSTYKNNLKLSLSYLIGYAIGQFILALMITIVAIVSLIGILFLAMYVQTQNTDLIEAIVINSTLRFVGAFLTITIFNFLTFSINDLIVQLKQHKLSQRIVLKPILFIVLIPICFLIHQKLDILLNRTLTSPEFYVGSQDYYKKPPQIIFDNGDTLWYTNRYFSRDIRLTDEEIKNIEFYDFKLNKTFSIKKPFFTINNPRAVIKLPNNKVLFVGGLSYVPKSKNIKKDKNTITYSNKIVDKNCFLFDVKNKTFQKVESIDIESNLFDAVMLPNGNVIFANSDFQKTSTKVQIFNNKTNTFLTAKMLYPVYNLKAIPLNNDKVLIFGIISLGKDKIQYKSQLFNLKTNKFEPTSNELDLTLLPSNIVLSNGDILFIGSKTINKDFPEKAVQTVTLYNPKTNKFSKINAKLATPRVAPDLTLLKNGSVLVYGGQDLPNGVETTGKKRRDFINNAEIFEPSTQTFKKVGDSKLRFLNTYHYGAKYSLPNGNILFLGGVEGHTDARKNLRSIEMFDLKTNTFKIIGNMRKTRTSGTIIPINENSIMIYGGDDTNKSRFERPSAEILDISRFNN